MARRSRLYFPMPGNHAAALVLRIKHAGVAATFTEYDTTVLMQVLQ